MCVCVCVCVCVHVHVQVCKHIRCMVLIVEPFAKFLLLLMIDSFQEGILCSYDFQPMFCIVL